MRAHILQHVPFEGIGSMASWLEKRSAKLSYTRFFENPVLPSLHGLDMIIAMGGPMSVNDEEAFPWLPSEKKFIRNAIDSGVSILGVCLGAQLIASALGARVYPMTQKEIGWFPIKATLTDAGMFSFPKISTVFHWHGETFDLPPGAVRLAKSKGCENQAFQIGRNVVGLQFHLETTPESLRDMIDNCGSKLVSRPSIQTQVQLRSVPSSAYIKINSLMENVLTYLIEKSSK